MKIVFFIILIFKISNYEYNEKQREEELNTIFEKLTEKKNSKELNLGQINIQLENLQIFSFYSTQGKLGNNIYIFNEISFILIFDLILHNKKEKDYISLKKEKCFSSIYYKKFAFIYSEDNTINYNISSKTLEQLNISYNIYYNDFTPFYKIINENDIIIKKFFQNCFLTSLTSILYIFPSSIYEIFIQNLFDYMNYKNFKINLTQSNLTHIFILNITHGIIDKDRKAQKYTYNNIKINIKYQRDNLSYENKVIEIDNILFDKYTFYFGKINSDLEFDLGIKFIFLTSKSAIS